MYTLLIVLLKGTGLAYQNACLLFRDLNKLQEGIGEKVGMFIFFMTIFIASLINAFVHGWELTLVILSVFPLLGISTGIIAKVSLVFI